MSKIEARLETQSNVNSFMQKIEQAEQDRQRSDENYKSSMNKIHTQNQNNSTLDSIEQSNTNRTKKKR